MGGQPAAAASAATMPNASGKIDGTTTASASGIRWTRWRCSSCPVNSVRWRRELLEPLAVVAEADDDRLRVEPVHCLEQQVDALVVEELPEVENVGLVPCQEALEPGGVALVRQPLVRVARVGWVAATLVEQVAQRLVAGLRDELLDVDAGRHLADALDRPDHLLQHLPDVVGADEDGFGGRQRCARRLGEIAAPADRVLELGAVRLDRERARRSAAPTAPPGSTWLQKTRSAGRCSKSAAAFAVT